jgi:peptidoglycan-associated lipoprotein
MQTYWNRTPLWVALILLTVTVAACGRKQPPVARPTPPPPGGTVESAWPPAPPEPMPESPLIPAEPMPDEMDLAAMDLDQLNRESPLQPVFFAYDSSDIDDRGQAMLQQNSQLLRRYPTWVVTIEGHTDERGTAEYNLALGERRALSARNYLVSLGVPGDRLRTVSYGKEFPFVAGSSEEAWSQNRRAHFVITGR